jgi:hypothetical protein
MNKVSEINAVIKRYFENNTSVGIVPAKDLMPYFIKAGIFDKDTKNGLPIRKILRDLDKSNQLHKIPHCYPERKLKNTKWFFVKTPNEKISPPPKKQVNSVTKETTNKRKDSDEQYVLDLCDKILNTKASRQHSFPFLLGDANSKGSQKKLPVDAYYEELNLVIEYRERQHSEAVPHFDKPNVMTVSGVNRGEQRRIYDQRRRDVLKEQKIDLIEIDYTQFNFNSQKKTIRNPELDEKVIQGLLIQKRQA